MKIHPYLSFDGQCRAALELYERALGGKVSYLLTYGDSPVAAQYPPEWSERIYHATFTFIEQTLGAADAPPGTYQRPQGFSLNIEMDDPAEAERVYAVLSANATIQMALQETHWARRFAVFTDQFGMPWMINCGVPA